jgi:hypothetical protein
MDNKVVKFWWWGRGEREGYSFENPGLKYSQCSFRRLDLISLFNL